METNKQKFNVLEQVRNFRWEIDVFQRNMEENKDYFLALNDLCAEMVEFCNSGGIETKDMSQQLEEILHHMYSLPPLLGRKQFSIFSDEAVQNHIYQTYTFLTLCTFLHTSRRIPGKSLPEFVAENPLLGFRDPDSPNYRQPQLQEAEAERLKKYRQRVRSKGKVNYKPVMWNAMTKDSEYEWRFYYFLQQLPRPVQETHKRMHNLYQDIRRAINPDRKMTDEEYTQGLEIAYKKFRSKLNKLKYERYLELQKAVLSYLEQDPEYYGINLYRLERRMRPCIILKEVKQLSACRDQEEEARLLLKQVLLDDVIFPKIYDAGMLLSDKQLEWFGAECWPMIQNMVICGCLVLDVLVELGQLGEDWEHTFLNFTNQLATSVLYDPKELDFSIDDKKRAQESFWEILNISVSLEIRMAKQTGFRWKKGPLDLKVAPDQPADGKDQ